MSILQDFSWQCKYSPNDGNLLKIFYIHALGCAVRYDRTTGFFSAETLVAASLGVEELIRNNGRMRLIVGCTLDEEETRAIQKGESLKNTVEASLLRSPFNNDDGVVRDGLELLAWMVAKGYLEVRVAVPCDPATKQPRHGYALFHEKAGIIEDKTGDRLVFNGSLNETLSGWTQNWETFHVFRSWKDDAAHLDADEKSFQSLWANKEPTATVLDLGQAVRQRLMSFLPGEGELPRRLKAHKGDPPAPGEQEKPVEENLNDIFKQTWQFIREAPASSNGGERVGEATSAVTPWPHQVHAFHRMYDNWPPKLLIADEVGLGKTIQAGLLLRQAWLAGRARRILILAPKAVLRQWQIELREKFNLNVPIYEDSQLQWFPSPALQGSATACVIEDDAWHKQPFVLASSHLMRRKERVRQLEAAEPWDIIVLDEAHHARRKGGAKLSKDTPNQLLRLMRGLKSKTQGLILLTATPMQVDPLEVWDLLSLLDMPAEWSAGNFLKFYEFASHPAPDEKALSFMARLFRIMEAHYAPLSLADATRIEPSQRKFIANKVLKALRDKSTIPLKMLNAGERRYALALMKFHSPTRVLISRHTRELLRHYHQAGKLSTKIATRKVTDFLVTLSPAERMLYDDVEDYISSTYDNAAQNERTAVGFVMTIYRRRLASSFYALGQTLQNRLAMLEQRGMVTQLSFEDIPDDDFEDDVLDSDDAAKLEKKALRLEETQVIRQLLERIRHLPVDTKVTSLIKVIEQLQHDGYRQIIVFTQYTDSLDFLRQQLILHRKPASILCFSGRGGERWNNHAWETISREKTKQIFKEGEAEILLCTDAAAEGLNFQFCGALVNYDMPWNPMKVEQRIGRIDRLGQQFELIRIINLMYADTVEADIYQTLRERIGLFGAFVGKLQPILSRLPRAFGELALTSRERLLAARTQTISQIQTDIHTQENSGFDLDELSLSSLEMPSQNDPLYDLSYLNRVLQNPALLPPGYEAFPLAGGKDYKYVIPGHKTSIRVTTDPAFYEEHAESVELWSPGSPGIPLGKILIKKRHCPRNIAWTVQRQSGMKIEKIRLKNFRCFGNEFVELNLDKELTTLVGANGSGKTAVLQAVSRLFGTSSAQRTVQRRDFHIPVGRQGLHTGDQLFIEAILGFPELSMQEDTPLNAVPEFFKHMSVSGEGKPPKVRIRLQATWTDDGTPDGTIEEEIRWILSSTDDFLWEDCPRVQAAERSSIQFIYLPANRDAATQVSSLLKGRLWQAARWSTQFKDESSAKVEDIQAAFGQEKPTDFLLNHLSHRWKQVHEADTDSEPCLRLIEHSFEELVRKAEFTFKPDESGHEHRLSELSDGQRSLFHIALTAATLETEQNAFSFSADTCCFEQDKLRRVYLTILAIEEPENSLSPFFLARIINLAREIGAFPSAQILLSSHSPAILGRIEPEEVRYLRLDRKSRCSSIRELTLPQDPGDASRYVRLAVKAYPELYFARFVILGEGDSERFIIPRLAEKMGVPLDPSFVPVVPLGGRFVEHFWRLLNELGIPHATLLDLDLGRQHGGPKIIEDCFQNLEKVHNKFWEEASSQYRDITPDKVKSLNNKKLLTPSVSDKWIKAFQENGIFFSYPIDLDFAMLRAFPDAYHILKPNERGPQGGASIQKKKETTLKAEGDMDLYDKTYDVVFKWYPYLFLNRSKPETHLAAFSRIPEDTIVRDAPAELKALITYVGRELKLIEEDA